MPTCWQLGATCQKRYLSHKVGFSCILIQPTLLPRLGSHETNFESGKYQRPVRGDIKIHIARYYRQDINFAKNSNRKPETPAVIFIKGVVCYGRTLCTGQLGRDWKCNPYVDPLPPPNLNPTSPKQPWRRLATSMALRMLITLHREACRAGTAASAAK